LHDSRQVAGSMHVCILLVRGCQGCDVLGPCWVRVADSRRRDVGEQRYAGR